ncbi:uncharacterized protein LOC133997902 [Scomber scombrus]|uniref:uncharacterized protein LOC133997902 n=1 Tax=Scomber scombrus TaxID=13677 RepID=UPI002DD7EA70|nr:uncharacterized protein LOC133997902 [Scomber scombrus]
MTDQDECNSTTWFFIGSTNTEAVDLIALRQIGEKAKAKSDRLSVTDNCSLVIKKVTVEDVGRYICRHYNTSGQQSQEHNVYLSVVSMTEHKDNDKVTFSCSVSIDGRCRYTVKWLYEGRDWDINSRGAWTSAPTCSANALLLTFNFIYTSIYESLQCKVTDLNSKEVQLYNFSSQLSDKKPGNDATTTPMTQTTEVMKPSTLNTTEQTVYADCSFLSYIMLVMRVAELVLITVVTVLLFRARAGNQRPPDDHTVS